MSKKLSLISSANIDDGLVRLGWDDGNSSDFHSSLRMSADRLDQPRDARPLMKGAYGSPPDWNNK